jgi:two-component system, CitB family, sensor kinase
MRCPRPRSLAGQLFAVQAALVSLAVAGFALFAYVADRAQAEDAARHEVTAAAQAIADSPFVREAARSADPSARLQPYAEEVRRHTGITFVTIMDTHGTRWTHPNPEEIGGTFMGHIDRALAGETVTETYTGTLGPSVRAVIPVYGMGENGGDGDVVGLVSAGLTVDEIGERLGRQVAALVAVAGGALAMGGIGSYAVHARLRRHTRGMNAPELSRMLDYHEAALHGVREGLLMLDGERRIALINDAARELLGLGPDSYVASDQPAASGAVLPQALGGLGGAPIRFAQAEGRPGAGRTWASPTTQRGAVPGVAGPAGHMNRALAPPPGLVGRHVTGLGLPAPLTEALLADEPRVDEVHLTAERVVVVNTSPVASASRRGTVVTLRDHTELQALAGELDSVRGFAEALRSQAHEAANRLHAVVSLIELGRADEAVEFATAELELAQALTDQVVGAVGEPVLAALLLGKAAQASERGVELVLAPDSRIDDGVLPSRLPARDLVTILGNLIDNAVDAAVDAAGGAVRPPLVTVVARAADGELLLSVSDTGAGLAPEAAAEAFQRGWSTKSPDGRGLGLALVRQAARRNGGGVEVTAAPGGGARFAVRLPLQAAAPAPREVPA